MTEVFLEGRLGDLVGRRFSFKTRTLKEVLSAIEANTGKLRRYLHHNGQRTFAIFVDDKEADLGADFNVNVIGKKVLIIPLLFGAIAATLTTMLVAGMKAGLMKTFATFIIGTVLSAALSFGISLLISKILKPDDPESLNTSSFVFGQAENVTKQGVVVPVGYGRMQVGSRVISVNMFNVDKGVYDNSSAGLYDILKVNNDPNPTTTIVDDGVIQVSTIIQGP
jgi:predicted phage tail protein